MPSGFLPNVISNLLQFFRSYIASNNKIHGIIPMNKDNACRGLIIA